MYLLSCITEKQLWISKHQYTFHQLCTLDLLAGVFWLLAPPAEPHRSG